MLFNWLILCKPYIFYVNPTYFNIIELKQPFMYDLD